MEQFRYRNTRDRNTVPEFQEPHVTSNLHALSEETLSPTMMMLAPTTTMVLLLVSHLTQAQMDFFDVGRCGACVAVADELTKSKQSHDRREQMDFTLGGRIDGKGRRKGKRIEYANSEVRAMEILEKTCEPMKDYGIVEQGGRAYYHKVSGGTVTVTGKVTLGTDQNKEDGRRLKTYCDAIVEEHEDALTSALRSDDIPSFRSHLCVDVANVCSPDDVATIASDIGPEPVDDDDVVSPAGEDADPSTSSSEAGAAAAAEKMKTTKKSSSKKKKTSPTKKKKKSKSEDL